MSDDAIREIDEAESVRISDRVDLGQEIAAHYQRPGVLTPEALDAVFAAWLEDEAEDRPSAEQVAVGLGCAFGDCFVRAGDYRWVVVTDSFGTELTILDETRDSRTYPINCVRKRIESRETGFFTAIHAVMGSLPRSGD